VVLSLAMAGLRPRLGERSLRAADALAGAGLIGFGGLLGWRAIREA